jgi:hypothetical protein
LVLEAGDVALVLEPQAARREPAAAKLAIMGSVAFLWPARI